MPCWHICTITATFPTVAAATVQSRTKCGEEANSGGLLAGVVNFPAVIALGVSNISTHFARHSRPACSKPLPNVAYSFGDTLRRFRMEDSARDAE